MKHTKVIRDWQVHKLSFTKAQINKVYPGMDLQPMVVTGTIVEDPSGKLKPGNHTRTSLVKKLDRKTKTLITKNSIYKLEGKEGNDVMPNLGDAVLNIFY